MGQSQNQWIQSVTAPGFPLGVRQRSLASRDVPLCSAKLQSGAEKSKIPVLGEQSLL